MYEFVHVPMHTFAFCGPVGLWIGEVVDIISHCCIGEGQTDFLDVPIV